MKEIQTPPPALGDPKPPRAHWGWGLTLVWGLLVVFLFVAVQSVVLSVVVLSRGGDKDTAHFEQAILAMAQDGYVLSVATFLATVFGIGLILGIIKLKRHAVLKDYLAITPVGGKTLLKWIGAVVVFVMLSDLLTLSLGRPISPEFMLTIYSSAKPVWMFWFALVVCAPLFEEVFFRGFLHKGLANSFLKPTGAVITTAIAWALIHLQYDLYGIATIAVAGLLLGAARVYTRSLITPIVLHTFMNVVATTQAAYAVAHDASVY